MRKNSRLLLLCVIILTLIVLCSCGNNSSDEIPPQNYDSEYYEEVAGTVLANYDINNYSSFVRLTPTKVYDDVFTHLRLTDSVLNGAMNIMLVEGKIAKDYYRMRSEDELVTIPVVINSSDKIISDELFEKYKESFLREELIVYFDGFVPQGLVSRSGESFDKSQFVNLTGNCYLKDYDILLVENGALDLQATESIVSVGGFEKAYKDIRDFSAYIYHGMSMEEIDSKLTALHRAQSEAYKKHTPYGLTQKFTTEAIKVNSNLQDVTLKDLYVDKYLGSIELSIENETKSQIAMKKVIVEKLDGNDVSSKSSEPLVLMDSGQLLMVDSKDSGKISLDNSHIYRCIRGSFIPGSFRLVIYGTAENTDFNLEILLHIEELY